MQDVLREITRPLDPGAGARPTSIIQREGYIAGLAALSILAYLVLRYGTSQPPWTYDAPLIVAVAGGGIPLILDLGKHVIAGKLGADLLAGMSIVTAVLMGEYLVAAIVVLMLSGGTALEQYATRRASSVLNALAHRMPRIAHRSLNSGLVDVALDEIVPGERLVVFPHEICPVDGTVLEGQGSMDESYLTGEPFLIPKAPGSQVLSGAINGEHA